MRCCLTRHSSHGGAAAPWRTLLVRTRRTIRFTHRLRDRSNEGHGSTGNQCVPPSQPVGRKASALRHACEYGWPRKFRGREGVARASRSLRDHDRGQQQHQSRDHCDTDRDLPVALCARDRTERARDPRRAIGPTITRKSPANTATDERRAPEIASPRVPSRTLTLPCTTHSFQNLFVPGGREAELRRG